jgi:copper chaperone CopZ
MTTRAHTYTVTGMTCAHCAFSVRAEVAELDATNVKGDGDGGAE